MHDTGLSRIDAARLLPSTPDLQQRALPAAGSFNADARATWVSLSQRIESQSIAGGWTHGDAGRFLTSLIAVLGSRRRMLETNGNPQGAVFANNLRDHSPSLCCSAEAEADAVLLVFHRLQLVSHIGFLLLQQCLTLFRFRCN